MLSCYLLTFYNKNSKYLIKNIKYRATKSYKEIYPERNNSRNVQSMAQTQQNRDVLDFF